MPKLNFLLILIILFFFALNFCCPKEESLASALNYSNSNSNLISFNSTVLDSIFINRDVKISEYFKYIDSIVFKYDSLTNYHLTEHLLVRSNPWIIDTLKNTDYYHMKAKDSFVYNQKDMIALPKANYILIVDSLEAKQMFNSFKKTIIDINIPEYKLRIYEDATKRFEFLVRVGRDEEKYLEMSGRIQDLKTKTGEGCIVSYNRNPRYVNPINNHEYFVTKRDDDSITKMPQIPFIETEINGVRNGQLIHPTTNPVTLGKAYSNGCIGTKESDAWVIYYYAPIDTKVKIRYDLFHTNQKGDTLFFKDIYNY
ncbi:MAG: L,D-transpeptidase [Winogradskyella sp.]|uniref:L,D-transpeptidase n=1 Tax=Winogradskyella sp. TaxID=1883156 RepID=UPI0017AA881F|nr:L,D-transpeptidase [Winogradskyella sp.]MBT8244455.1 L,D-transpeptidase [Winogradskyella sp.]NNK22407.1 L,D-transpeptidase [Winogradskyella sp.]